jgi:hypothetical protein
MFFGTTPGPVRDYLASEIRRIAPSRVFEPCAGNFVLSFVCGAINKQIEVRSGDVSLYSVAIGHGLANQDGGIRLKPEVVDRYPFFKDKTSPAEIAATVILWAELAINLEKSHIAYCRAIARDVESNLPKVFGQVLSKVEKAKEALGKFTFTAQDACKTLQDVQSGDFVLYDPPYYLGDYEKMYEALVKYFDFPKIPYTQITEEIKLAQLQELRQRGADVFFRCEEVPENTPGFNVVFKYLYKAEKYYYVLSNSKSEPAHGWRQILPSRKARYDVLWGKELEPGMTAEIVPVASDLANHYRLLWTKKAMMRDAGNKFLLVVGGKVCGVISIMSADRYGHQNAVIVADAAPLNTPYRRLGKLVLYTILSREFLERINKTFMWEHTGFTTLAYTNNPVSMKYRGLFELADRKTGAPGGHKYTLTYRTSVLPFDTIQQGYDEWLRKFGDDLVTAEMASGSGLRKD